ncbi:17.7 kDa class II heat shock protein [Hibiscus syriacus]|uniref:17.7 kDa class II heat shock protein n=1 Tax=Hibiscus syriacus TaxID=106335 RepID=A0A6A2WE76_HIBSY|nr:17.7 kDa class II heat shock protein [Hibiscus syriacus]
MNFNSFGFDSPILTVLEEMLDIPEEQEKTRNNPSRANVRNAKAVTATPADGIEYPTSYVFMVDMTGINHNEIKVQEVGKFMRNFQLPDNANTDKISAVVQDGALRVTVDKILPPQPKTSRSKLHENLDFTLV